MNVQGENVCRFTGNLFEYSVRTVGDGYKLGKGKLFLPSEPGSAAGQTIKVTAWGEVAESLELLPEGASIMILSSYTPSVYRNTLYDDFTVWSFRWYKG